MHFFILISISIIIDIVKLVTITIIFFKLQTVDNVLYVMVVQTSSWRANFLQSLAPTLIEHTRTS